MQNRIEALSAGRRELLARRLARLCAATGDASATKRLVAYVVAGGAAPAAGELRAFLKQSLPDYMVPSRFVVLDGLPLMPNGKVDYKSLPDPDTSAEPATGTLVEPSNDVERKLAEIWAEVLGLDVVGVHDNFFEVGGDSILSIQIIARAKRAGIHLTPQQVFQHLTIAELARVAGSAAAPRTEQGMVTGEVPLTPIQRWFFERALPNAHYWNQTYILEAPKDIDVGHLGQALQHLVSHHDVLRSRFQKQGPSWRQEITAAVDVPPVQRHDVAHLDSEAQAAAIESIAAALQATLDISAGRLLAAAVFACGASDRVCIAIHHLAVDGVSWRILLEDLHTAYAQLGRRETVQLPAKTTAYKTWAEGLAAYARSDTAREELEYWSRMVADDGFRIPLDRNGDNTEASERKLVTELTVEETTALLKEVPAAYNTRIDDVLLTALVLTLGQWTGRDTIALDMEGHGREDVVDGADLSRTVGWFTSFFPQKLSLATQEPGDAIKSIKEQLRRIPKRGIGFGILRYLSDDAAIRDKLHQIPAPPVLYNYLGQFDASGAGGAFRPTLDSAGPCHDPTGPRSHPLEIDAIVIEDRLRLDWVYSENLHERSTIEAVARDYMHHLRRLIAHCKSPEAGGFSPSDFPEAKLGQDELDELLNQIGDR